MGHGATASALAGDTAARPPVQRHVQGTDLSMQGSPRSSETGVDEARFRSVLGRFATGVVAVTAFEPGGERPVGLAANSFTSVSLDPPLVAFCVAHTSTTWPRLRDAGRLCVNILSEPQRKVCERLALRGGDKFAGVDWTRTPHGGPLIEGALAWIECSVEQEHVAGDHVIVVARVHALDEHDDADPLLFYRGSYGTFA